MWAADTVVGTTALAPLHCPWQQFPRSSPGPATVGAGTVRGARWSPGCAACRSWRFGRRWSKLWGRLGRRAAQLWRLWTPDESSTQPRTTPPHPRGNQVSPTQEKMGGTPEQSTTIWERCSIALDKVSPRRHRSGVVWWRYSGLHSHTPTTPLTPISKQTPCTRTPGRRVWGRDLGGDGGGTGRGTGSWPPPAGQRMP